MIPYANMAPFRELGPPVGCRFVDLNPKESIAALRQKRVWAAAVPVGGLQALGGQVRFLGCYGIAARSQVMSVMFFTDHPFEAFRHPLTMRLTGESSSSVRLLYLLLGYQHGFETMPLRLDSEQGIANGTLQIGDTALDWVWEMERHGSVQGYGHMTDLASLWYRRQRLPFVFARWVVHVQAPQALHDTLMLWLRQFEEREPALIEQAIPGVAARLKLPEIFVARYLRVIRRCLTAEDLAGQELFSRELERHAGEPLFAGQPKAKAPEIAQGGNHDVRP